jgi:hypothetical protein
VVTLAVLAFSTYNGFYAYSFAPQMAVYALPLAAIFLARLHLVELARSRSALAVGVLWLAFLVAAGAGLTLKDARAESGTVRGPGGSLRDEPAKARAYRGALDAILRETRPGAPILLAPQLTWLYTLSGRANPLPETSLLPGALASAADERAAIARLERSNVRFAVIDEHAYTGYGHTSFGHSFDRVLAAWIHHNFVHEATFPSGGGPESPVLQTWVRRT